MSVDIKTNLELINDRIQNALVKTGRSKDSVKLMAVSKFHKTEEIIKAINAGQLLFGENRVQEACQKFETIFAEYPQADLHIIGQLQTNKVKHAVQIASCIQSVDRIDLLREIEKQCAKINKSINVLFEYHTGEESKSGFTDIQTLINALDLCSNEEFPHIVPCGFMTMAPFTQDKDLIRKSFITLRELSFKMQEKYKNLKLTELSMGMSGDFEIAIEEGSTLVRVGTAIFGERVY